MFRRTPLVMGPGPGSPQPLVFHCSAWVAVLRGQPWELEPLLAGTVQIHTSTFCLLELAECCTNAGLDPNPILKHIWSMHEVVAGSEEAITNAAMMGDADWSVRLALSVARELGAEAVFVLDGTLVRLGDKALRHAIAHGGRLGQLFADQRTM